MYYRILCVAYTRGVLGNDIQYRLDISRRAGDDTKNLTRRRLLFQRLLEFLEESDVLNGDDRLVGKGFKKLSLRWSERVYLGSTRTQRSNELLLQTKRSDQEAAKPAGGTQHREIVCAARASGT